MRIAPLLPRNLPLRSGLRLMALVRHELGHQARLLTRAARIALFVGTCLTLINQGDIVAAAILHGIRPGGAILWKIPLTYTVPFLVSWYSSVTAAKSCPVGPSP